MVSVSIIIVPVLAGNRALRYNITLTLFGSAAARKWQWMQDLVRGRLLTPSFWLVLHRAAEAAEALISLQEYVFLHKNVTASYKGVQSVRVSELWYRILLKYTGKSKIGISY